MRAILRRSACWLLLGVALDACSSESRHALPFEAELDQAGTLRGQLVVQLADVDDGTTETRYFLHDAEGVDHRLVVRGSVDVAPGSWIKIRGKRRASGSIDVGSYDLVGDPVEHDLGSRSQPPVDGGPASSRVLCAGLVGLNGGTPKTTTAAVSSAFHTGAASVNSFFRENSYGKFGLGGGVYGPFAYNMTDCDYTGLATAIRPMIDAAAPAKCDQYAFIFGPTHSACGWSGFPQYGTREAPTKDSWFNDTVACVVAVQEPSHNYGLLHSSSLTCGTSPFADDLASCTHSEYGDKYDAMGSGCYHMNAWQKLYQRWFSGCNGVSTSSSGTFYLHALEMPCSGVQVLRLPFPGGKARFFENTTLTSYYLELRAKLGFDAKVTVPSVFIHAGGDPPLPNQVNVPALHTWLLDLNGSTPLPGLFAGESFTDPAGGLTIRVQSIEPTRATIDIEYAAGTGSPYCLDGIGSSFRPPGPEGCLPDGGTAGTGGAGGSDVGGAGGIGPTGGSGGMGTGGTGTGGSGTGGAGGVGGSATGGTGGTGGIGTGGSGGSETDGGGTDGSGTDGGGTDGGGTGGSGTGGSGTGTGGSSGGSGGSGGNAGEGGTGSGGDAGRGGSAGDPTGGASGGRATGGMAGISGAGTSGSGGLDGDASTVGDSGTDEVDLRHGACICTLPARSGASSRRSVALATLGVVAACRRRRRRPH